MEYQVTIEYRDTDGAKKVRHLTIECSIHDADIKTQAISIINASRHFRQPIKQDDVTWMQILPKDSYV